MFPLTPEEIRAKFIDCARRFLGPERAEGTCEVVWTMRRQSSVRALVDEVVLRTDREKYGVAVEATGRGG